MIEFSETWNPKNWEEWVYTPIISAAGEEQILACMPEDLDEAIIEILAQGFRIKRND